MTFPITTQNILVASLQYCLQASRLQSIRDGAIKSPKTSAEIRALASEALQLEGVTSAQPNTAEHKKAKTIETHHRYSLFPDRLLPIDRPMSDHEVEHLDNILHADEEAFIQAIEWLEKNDVCKEAIELLRLITEREKGDGTFNESLDGRIDQLCSLINPDTLQLFTIPEKK